MSGVVMVTVGIDRGVFAGISQRAAPMNRDPKAYIRQLVDAAYAARVARERKLPVGDLEMDDAVRAVFCLAGEFDVKSIARATGYSEEFCDNVLRGWKQALAEPSAPKPPRAPAPDTSGGPETAPPAPADGSGYPVEQIRALWAEGLSTKEIAARIGRTAGAFSVWAGKHRDICPKRRNA